MSEGSAIPEFNEHYQFFTVEELVEENNYNGNFHIIGELVPNHLGKGILTLRSLHVPNCSIEIQGKAPSDLKLPTKVEVWGEKRTHPVRRIQAHAVKGNSYADKLITLNKAIRDL